MCGPHIWAFSAHLGGRNFRPHISHRGRTFRHVAGGRWPARLAGCFAAIPWPHGHPARRCGRLWSDLAMMLPSTARRQVGGVRAVGGGTRKDRSICGKGCPQMIGRRVPDAKDASRARDGSCTPVPGRLKTAHAGADVGSVRDVAAP